MIPFDAEKKNAIYIRNDPEDDEQVDIYMIGAPDNVIYECSKIQNPQQFDFADHFDYELKEQILRDVVNGQMANIGLKTISFAYKRMEKDEYE
jgi:hypothetical protein